VTGIRRVGVLGAGLMGSGIAQVSASCGYDTVIRDVNDGALSRGRNAVEKSLARFVEKVQLDAVARDAALRRMTWTTDLGAITTTDIVIEAVTEDLALKTALYRELHPRMAAEVLFS
jgi:3-hydroxybutyryl-CoA dehydrogenase